MISVLIPDGEDPLALEVVRSLGRAPRVRVDLLSADRRPTARFSRFCRRCHPATCSLTEPERLQAVLARLERSRYDVLLPVSVAGCRLVSRANHLLAPHVALPPLACPETLDTANDKTALARLAARYEVPVPASLVFPDQRSDNGALSRLTFPVLFKPPSLEGGRGIRRFEDRDTLARFLETHPSAQNGRRYLVQSYIEGSDLGLNVLCREGEILAWTVQRAVHEAARPFGVAQGVSFYRDDRVLELGRRLLSAMGWTGVANLDFRRCGATGEINLLEMNPRFWGTLMGSVHAGVNFPYLACLAALGRPAPPLDYRPTVYADTKITLQHFLGAIAGSPRIPGLRLPHTRLWAAATDPLPAAAFRWCRALRKPRSR